MGIKLVKKNEAAQKALEYSIGDTITVKVLVESEKMMVRCTPEYGKALEMGANEYTWGYTANGTKTTIARLRSLILGLIGKPLLHGRDFAFKDPIAAANATAAVANDAMSDECEEVVIKMENDLKKAR